MRTAVKVIEDALAIEAAGAFAIILESVPDQVSKIVTESLRIPTISYGAGMYCDGQGLVAHDILGMFDSFTPKFAKKYENLSTRILDTFSSYVDDVVNQKFPTDQHSYHIKKSELDKVLKNI